MLLCVNFSGFQSMDDAAALLFFSSHSIFFCKKYVLASQICIDSPGLFPFTFDMHGVSNAKISVRMYTLRLLNNTVFKRSDYQFFNIYFFISQSQSFISQPYFRNKTENRSRFQYIFSVFKYIFWNFSLLDVYLESLRQPS